MLDFWAAAGLTAMVSVVTVLADWLAWRLIVGSRVIHEAIALINSGWAPVEVLERLRNVFDRYKYAQSSALIWGADLAVVAVSMDFAALGLWIHDKTLFPFFERFSNPNVSREILVWFLLIGFHFMLMVLSLIM